MPRTDQITSAMPEMYYNGIQAIGEQPPYREMAPSPDHCPIFYCWMEQGPIATDIPAVWVPDAATRINVFGSNSFDELGKYVTHQTVASNITMQGANAHFLSRLWPADGGPKATIRWWLHIKPTQVPVYLTNDDGSWQTTPLGQPIQNGNLTISGAQLMITTEPITETAGVGSFGQANINNNSILGVGATAIPWFDQEVTWYGEYGNNKGTQIYAPTTRTPEPLDTALFEATRCYPFKMSLMERVNALSTPQKVMRISGEYTLDFNVKPNSLYRALNKEMYLERVFKGAWSQPAAYGQTAIYGPSANGQTAIYGPFGRIKLYQNNIDTFLRTLFDLEKAAHPEFTDIDEFADPDTEKYVINFLSATTTTGAPYKALHMADITPYANAISLNEGNYVFASGAFNGTMTDATHEALAIQQMKRFTNTEEEITSNLARYPIMDIYDTGYSLDGKNAVIDCLAGRQQLNVYLSTHTVNAKPLTASEESSLGLYLYTRALSYPESTYHATQCCRAQIFARSGPFLGTSYQPDLPLLFEALKFNCNVLAASSGVWKTELIPDVYAKNVITQFAELNVDYIPPRQQLINWNRGVIYPLDLDMYTKQMGPNQTVYPNDSSVLNNYWVVKGATALFMIGHRLWREFRGNTTFTQLQLQQRIEKRFDELVVETRKFADLFLIQRQVKFTSADLARGYSWTLLVQIGGSNLRTVQSFALQAWQYEQLEQAIADGTNFTTGV